MCEQILSTHIDVGKMHDNLFTNRKNFVGCLLFRLARQKYHNAITVINNLDDLFLAYRYIMNRL